MANPVVMVNGLPGNMGREVARAALRRGWTLVPFALTGEAIREDSMELDGMEIAFLKDHDRDERIGEILMDRPGLIAVDYTHPDAVNGNAEFYVRHKIPFVMGTTGGDRAKLRELLSGAGLGCVVAPNMAKQIVGFQAMVERAAEEFPGLFAGWKLSVRESHQSGKADTSGTAKAVVASMAKWGLDASVEKIEKIREPAAQLAFGVPEESLKGHAFHTYSIDSPDGTVHFEFRHNVCGRAIYAEGTCDVVAFLKAKLESGEHRLFSMSDVLREGIGG